MHAPKNIQATEKASLRSRVGRLTNSPAQLGQMLLRTCTEHLLQNVHSNEQILASFEFAGSAAPHFSQCAFISNINFSVGAILSCRTRFHRSSEAGMWNWEGTPGPAALFLRELSHPSLPSLSIKQTTTPEFWGQFVEFPSLGPDVSSTKQSRKPKPGPGSKKWLPPPGYLPAIGKAAYGNDFP
jgi:hypothetical protein